MGIKFLAQVPIGLSSFQTIINAHCKAVGIDCPVQEAVYI